MIKLSTLLKEDETQDKLDDLSTAFKTASVPAYVSLLQKYSSDPKVMAVLKAGQTDGQPNDEKFDVSETTIAAKNLKPTQNEIGAEESLKNIATDQYGSLDSFLKGTPDVGGPIITYNGEFVLDGHHRWSQVYAANPDAKLKAVNVVGKIDPNTSYPYSLAVGANLLSKSCITALLYVFSLVVLFVGDTLSISSNP